MRSEESVIDTYPGALTRISTFTRLVGCTHGEEGGLGDSELKLVHCKRKW